MGGILPGRGCNVPILVHPKCYNNNSQGGNQKVTKKIKKLLKNPLTKGTKCAIIIKMSEREPTPTTYKKFILEKESDKYG